MPAKRRTKAEREAAAEIETTIRDAMYGGIEQHADDWRRDHLGASLMGHKCQRYLWLSFRWSLDPKHDGRQLRLFERGDREEPAIVRDLQRGALAGMTVLSHNHETGDQWRIRIASTPHIGGSLDGIVKGVPGFKADDWFLLEMKTANRKSFDYLKAKKVRSAKREHWVQMQVYMHGFHEQRDLKAAIYVAVCKDTDEIYVELVDRDAAAGYLAVEDAQKIVEADEPPAKMDEEQVPCVYTSKDGTRWPCDFFDLCHGSKTPERNCRTCVSATPTDAGDWTCGLNLEAGPIPPENQRTGCNSQLTIPPIINAELASISAEDRTALYQFPDGTRYLEEGRDL